MNQVTIAGHLGGDPEVRFTSSGGKVTVLRVAARVRKGGKEETIWWRVTLWGDQFDKVIPYFKKGSSIIIVGEMNPPEIFTDREGQPKASISMTGWHVQFSPFGKGDGNGAAQGDLSRGVSIPVEEQVVTTGKGQEEEEIESSDGILF